MDTVGTGDVRFEAAEELQLSTPHTCLTFPSQRSRLILFPPFPHVEYRLLDATLLTQDEMRSISPNAGEGLPNTGVATPDPAGCLQDRF